uniref:Myosin light chain kinase 3 n=1 Tax=Pelodiscus sinensis TaxID=13735 RepID=K7G5B5_PELSI
LSTLDKKLNLLNEKVDKLLSFQEGLNGTLQKVNRGIDDIGKNIDKLTASQATAAQTETTKRGLKPGDNIHPSETQSVCSEMLKLMRAAQQDALKHRERLEEIEKMFDTVDKVIAFVGETFKNSQVVDFILRGIVPWKKGSLVEILVETKDKPEEKGAKPKHVPSNRGAQAESKKSLEAKKGCDIMNNTISYLEPKTEGKKSVNQKSKDSENKPAALTAIPTEAVPSMSKSVSRTEHEAICTRNNNVSTASILTTAGGPWSSQPPQMARGPQPPSHGGPQGDPIASQPRFAQLPSRGRWQGDSRASSSCGWISINVQMTDTQQKIEVANEGSLRDHGGTSSKVKSAFSSPLEAERVKHLTDKFKHNPCHPNARTDPIPEVKGVKLVNKQNEQAPKLGKPQMLLNKVSTDKKSLERSEDDRSELECAKLESAYAGQKGNHANQCMGKTPENSTSVEASKAFVKQDEVIIDDSPPPPAPFEHRIVSIKQTDVTTCYSVCRHEVLGGGRFGQVHKCTELSTGLNLAAKIIKAKGAKEREEVKNEINIMNQLNHVNLIQLYDAFECKNNLTLIMEYVDGGELFDRITDENYHLTEMDAILFTKQICEGVHYIHQQYILHLDLKPENILCINHTGNQIKIIDFGLARRYKPREKLKVNFGTPEFLAPEVVNYDFVSFPTDMWSVGVITYMLLSGLSPFLGETDAETMNYIVNCSWDFDAEAFEQLSEEAKDFISKLLVKEKSCRMSAAQCLKHEWLNDLPGKAKKSKLRLKSQLLLQHYVAHRKWKKHFYVVAAANRLRRFPSMSVNLA